jgi:uncharacterized membrane protein
VETEEQGGKNKIMMALFGLALLGLGFADEFDGARQLIASNVSCDKLDSGQLEAIGDYLMEQMHPGPSHQAMEDMMGGDGSENVRRAHIQMAEVLYCGRTNTTLTFGAMLGMMPFIGRYSGGGMMGFGGYGQGMMGYGYGGAGYMVEILFGLLVFCVLALALFWLYKNLSGSGAPATEILKQRYAKGEISKKEFEEMMRDINK